MNILDRMRSFEYDKNRDRIFGIESAIVWCNSKDDNGAVFPILYISKSKHISQEDYELLLDNIEIRIKNKHYDYKRKIR